VRTDRPKTTVPKPSQSDLPVLCVVIPVYNERDTWRTLLDRAESAELPGCRKRIILVDDASTDGTREQLEEFARQRQASCGADGGGRTDLKVLFHDRNRGKGAALRTGFAAADGDFVIVQDADLEYDPADYPRLLQPLLAGQADVVYGSRFSKGGAKGYLRSYLANRFLTCFSNLTTGLKLTDMETCYKVFKRQVLRAVRLEQDRFGFEPEITAKVAHLGLRVIEVPISYNARTHKEGKKIGWKDGLKAVWCILKYAPPARFCRGPSRRR
jgi:glycosyltransferase involved in cell wall biosynthesis